MQREVARISKARNDIFNGSVEGLNKCIIYCRQTSMNILLLGLVVEYGLPEENISYRNATSVRRCQSLWIKKE